MKRLERWIFYLSWLVMSFDRREGEVVRSRVCHKQAISDHRVVDGLNDEV